MYTGGNFEFLGYGYQPHPAAAVPYSDMPAE